MGKVEGKVALVTGAARGQGRSHAVRLAAEGADVIVVDVPREVTEIAYPTGTREELEETVALVEGQGRRAVAIAADVRDVDDLVSGVASAVEQLGRLDIIAANAGIASNPFLSHEMAPSTWNQMIDINLTGVWNTVHAGVPHVLAGDRGGAVVLTSSAAGLKGYAHISHYSAAKHGVVGLMRSLANELAPSRVRVNSLHPTQVDTPMIQNEGTYRIFSPQLEAPTRDDFEQASRATNALPVPWVDVEDVSNALMFLVSDEARYVTGVALPIDAGTTIR
ncbi:mycofactocin-coupled SDR family oxidoreductase [Nocardioides zeae]|uniref:Mycofactocin-coupled SDR family oxidoreductase n=1 Tax=Nocardioides imazamoxiresistens TaxID=3231893 RepID=A0ABU3PTS1_9ACTN|nr:mycofactocin-coupled SDR family oxidoreductase [Nocardioides zeae]MDT9592200.1 mycofactocin-coupled SDR family oxidoreductase [Nocardioides zeae]